MSCVHLDTKLVSTISLFFLGMETTPRPNSEISSMMENNIVIIAGAAGAVVGFGSTSESILEHGSARLVLEDL
ncbi:uncharacterized protein N7479_007989 [Penicillium vulpinum]|uniref:uncharacterized protein n=1 Tax=Penicillium vulpinum TaxID=29845 RepID=UPI0025493691|nr:uncharacterized protein N7479_007989 [Penicillium vulpinum]KAJ5960839.1 hypothetical protein N7479_007989 [Penicillium vulpinum]